jgi:tetratricopeptide (TPR) repeat protein
MEMHRLIVFIIFSLFCGLAYSARSIEDLKSLVDSENYAAAAETGEQLLIEYPGHARIQFLTAYAYQNNRQNWKAAYHYRQLILQHPGLPEPRNNLAMIYIADGDYDKASQLLVDAINTNRSYAIAYQNLNRIYASMASEAYRRAVSESGEAPKQRPKIELTALSSLESVDRGIAASPPTEQNTLVDIANFETILIEKVINWAKAWGDKDIDTYASFYSSEYKPNFATHEDWVEHRRERIMQPAFIKIGVSKIQIRTQSENRAIIEFEQSYDSPGYTDRVIKRLALSRVGSQWKITDEQVISIP